MPDYQKFWSNICDSYDPFVLDFIIPYGLCVTVFTLTIIPFTFLDFIASERFVKKYKVQPSKDHPDLWKKLPRYLAVSIFNVYILGFFVHLVAHYCRKWNGFEVQKKLPSTVEFVKHAAICIALEEIAFYYTHRLFHYPFFYKLIHKQHHEWTSPISIASRFCNPLEHIVSYDGPLVIGPILTNAHIVTTLIWYTVGIVTTVCHHTGYKIPFLPTPEFHDSHHETFNHNFGILGAMDLIHKTENWYGSGKNNKKDQ